MENLETTDILIVGCGPTGAMLSTLLGQYGVKNIALEREPEITTDPRGIALDEDGIRCLQACGIYDKVFTDIGQCMLSDEDPPLTTIHFARLTVEHRHGQLEIHQRLADRFTQKRVP